MLRRQFAQSLSAPIAGFARQGVPGDHRPPNVVLLLADDLGYGDLGCYGQQRILTPHLDLMAAEGMRFTAAYAGSAVCAPSRCSLLTGLHTGHCRIRGNRSYAGARISLEPEDNTVASRLQEAGYRTGAIGKWGIGEAGSRGTPEQKGFHSWLGYLNQDHALNYYPQQLWRDGREWFPKGNQGMKRETYAQDLFIEEAIRFLRDHRERPFFLYLPFTLPHADSERSRDTGDGYVVPDYGAYRGQPWDSADKGYAAMVSRLDHDAGRLLAELRALGIERDTLVLFVSDNGPANEGRHRASFFESAGRVGGQPLKGRKGNLYEGGIRVPAIARWPGVIPAGTRSDHPWYFADLMPTLLELAGLPIPPSLDGESIAPVLRGERMQRKADMYWELPGSRFQQAIRRGDWKLVREARGAADSLYNVRVDPGERRDLAGSQQDLAVRLARRMDAWRTDSPHYPVQ